MSENTTGHTVIELKKRYDDLKDRCMEVRRSLQSAIPVSGRPIAAQEAFLMAVGDMRLPEYLLESGQTTMNAINLDAASPDDIEQAGDFVKLLANSAKEMIEMVVKQLGVSADIVIPTMIKDLARDIELIETIVLRVEASLPAMGIQPNK